ncbi:hypothetical protein GCM10022631_37700 [Deinococcus rubellus]|uniref:HAD hydrolase-like protein n=1 Tax=Deinococcus rubellus TaxID=1889240 RepID=A0ABY5YHC2_9DEIO|nr:HAD hydrolase-like protein [Deinococcus rubellus]UWX63203.1 HAD hydrolase-like protein [Deinococcus rubellus]
MAAEETLMMGDTEYDAEAARKAGVRCVLLRCGGNEELPGVNLPGEVCDDPAALLVVLERGDLA